MMFMDRDKSSGEATSQERRDTTQPHERVLGHVVRCDGARAVISALAEPGDASVNRVWTVGKLITISLATTRVVGLVYQIVNSSQSWDEQGQNPIEVHVELHGEVRDDQRAGKPVFDRGITSYPHIGALAHRIRSRDLQAIYELSGRSPVAIGTLSQDEAIEACVSVDDMLARHFAVVGTTGVGKSTAVSLLVRKAIAARPDLRILILDPHNEFAHTFPGKAVRIDTRSLDLPFWLFRLEEIVEVLFRGRESVAEEVELLRDMIPLAKLMYKAPATGGLLRRSSDANAITADTPVPYRMADLLRIIDERIGLLDTKNDRPTYRALKARIEAAVHDPRYRFMFTSKLIEDTIHQTIGRIFRVPHEGHPITCFEMAGMPSEVVNSVCSVLARLAFDLALWSEGALKLLVLCEEAHRYMPADLRLGFAPTRHALARIAKEGRKYGCYLGVVTQRPGELDPTILSQCSTVFAMRLANEADQEIIRSAISDSSASTLSFLASMGQREAIAFGEGVATTMRMKFEKLDASLLPGSDHRRNKDDGIEREVDLLDIVEKLRNVPRDLPGNGLGEPIGMRLQPGDPGYARQDVDGPVAVERRAFGQAGDHLFRQRGK
jgi:uncharacterized protein